MKTIPQVRYVTIKRFCELTGYSEEAVRENIATGKWVLNREWCVAPDKHVFIEVANAEKSIDSEGLN